MDTPFVSTCIINGNYKTCVSGTKGNYRYTVFCPDSTTLISDSFSKVLEAQRAALRKLIIISAKHRETPRQFP